MRAGDGSRRFAPPDSERPLTAPAARRAGDGSRRFAPPDSERPLTAPAARRAGDGNRTRVLSLGNRIRHLGDQDRFIKAQLSGVVVSRLCCPVMPVSDQLWHGYGTDMARRTLLSALVSRVQQPGMRDDHRRLGSHVRPPGRQLNRSRSQGAEVRMLGDPYECGAFLRSQRSAGAVGRAEEPGECIDIAHVFGAFCR